VIEGGGESTPERAPLRSVDSARDLQNKEREAGTSEGQATSPEDQAKSSDVREREQSGGGWQNNFTGQNAKSKGKGDWRATLKKRGPLGLILAVLGGGGFALGALLSPSLLLIQMKTIFTNDRSDSSPAVQVHANALITNKAKSLNSKLGVCGDKVTIHCKFGTMSNRQLNKFKKAGFQIETEKKFGRNVIKSMTLPDGRKIEDPKQLQEVLKEPKVAAAFQQVFSVATPFISNFFSTVLGKLGLSKVAKVTGETKEKVKESFRSHLGLDPDGTSTTKFKTAVGKAKGIADKAGKTVGLELGCLAYNVSRITVNSIKIAKGAALAAFALTFMIAADQILAGDAEPEVISQLGTQLTSTNQDPNDPTYGLAATDSTMFKAALFGDTNSLPGYATQYLLGGSALAASLATGVKFVNDLTGGTRNTKAICKLVQGTGYLQCLAGWGGLAGCAAMETIGAPIVEKIVKDVIEKALEQGSKMELNDKTIGVKAGDAIGVGLGVILGRMSQSYGMKPSNRNQIKQYLADTDEVRQQDIAIAKYQGQQNPMDINNQYSFLGSMATSLRLSGFSGTSFTKNVSNLFALIPSSLLSATTVGAQVYQPVTPYNEARFNKCEDPGLEEAGIDGDLDCGVRFTQSSEQMNMDVDANLDYMVNNGHIADDDLTGTPKSDDYKKYIEFCVDREDPFGSTSKAIEDGDLNDEDWYSGKKCHEDSDEINNFGTFTTRLKVDSIMDDGDAGSSDASAYLPLTGASVL
jgi:hypothetical protein